MLQSIGLQRVGYDWVTRQQQLHDPISVFSDLLQKVPKENLIWTYSPYIHTQLFPK